MRVLEGLDIHRHRPTHFAGAQEKMICVTQRWGNPDELDPDLI
jgi:hypothetical protein